MVAPSELEGGGERAFHLDATVEVDCAALRPLREHARQLAAVFGTIEHGYSSEPAWKNPQWTLARQWLDMAAGLDGMLFDLRPDADPLMYCDDGNALLADRDRLHARYATEFTRLQFVWNACERLLRVSALPPLPSGLPKRLRNPFGRGAILLKEAVVARPAHYECVQCHLRTHLQRDPGYADFRDGHAFEPSKVHGPNAFLLIAGNLIRNFPAHGDVLIPQPDRPAANPNAFPWALHTPRLATRGLLLSIQMLLVAMRASLPRYLVGPAELAEGQVGVARAAVVDLVAELHLKSSGGSSQGDAASVKLGDHHTCHLTRT
jgi:hypothetical protein